MAHFCRLQLKAFIKDLAFVQVVNFMVKPLWILLVDRAVQNQLGEELYGQYYAAFNLAALFIILTDLGLNNYLTKDAVDESKSSRSIIRNSIKIKLTLSLIYLSLILFIGWQKDIEIGLVFWVGLNLVLLSISQWLRVWFNVTKAFRKESLIAISDRLVSIVLWLGVFALMSLDNEQILQLFLGVQSLGFITAIGIAVYFIYKKKSVIIEEQATSISTVISSCLPFTLLAFFMAAFTRVDVLIMDNLLGEYSSSYHIGVYAQGSVILNAGNMMAALFGTMLLPIFTKQVKSSESVKPIMKVSTLILGLSGVLVFIVLQVWGKEIYKVYYQEGCKEIEFQYKLRTFCTVIMVYIPMALTYVFGTYLTALGKLKELVVLALITLILNIALNFMLQPDLKANGAATAALITQSFFCLSCIVMTLVQLRKTE